MALFKKNKEPEMVEREDGLTDYDVYVMSKNETIINIIIACVVLFAIGYVFYKSVILSALLMILSIKWPKMRTKQIIAKRKRQLNVQFKDMLYAVSSSLSAGKSVETAFIESVNDLKILYPDPNCDIIREVTYIAHGLAMNETVETMLGQFAERTHIEDIENFADVFVTCKRTGGNIVEMVRSTSNIIADKIEIKMDIETLVSGKKFEQQVMSLMPIAMILVMTYTSYDYMQPMFETLVGRIIMTVAVAIFGISTLIGNKIMNIEV